ncbi:MAG: hypothetical protein EZS28_040212 [Streblomastix strix]|uniref:Uncharacterized protein n=1 Tax=Streblomastix strix TaxID=222440 RepID=A0A5J4U2N1_9EUKA|nr:MAG: hypothetical protein EZS28_040212 [Streblomastix strix]
MLLKLLLLESAFSLSSIGLNLSYSHSVFLPNPSSELKVQTSNANTTTNSCQTTPVVEWEELRFKPTDEKDRAARGPVQVQTSKTSKLSTSLHDSSHGSPQRKQVPIPGQSLMIKDPACLDAKNQCK